MRTKITTYKSITSGNLSTAWGVLLGLCVGILIGIFIQKKMNSGQNLNESLFLEKTRTSEDFSLSEKYFLPNSQTLENTKASASFREIVSKAIDKNEFKNPTDQPITKALESDNFSSLQNGNIPLQQLSRPSVLSMKDVNSEQDHLEFLEKVELPSIVKVVESSKTAKSQSLQKIRGHYAGKIEFNDQRPNRWEVELNVRVPASAVSSSGAASADESDIKVSMYADGELFFGSKATGAKHDFLEDREDPEMLLLKVMEGDGYLQIYESPTGDKLFGNYYEIDANRKYKKRGTLFLYSIAGGRI